MKYIQFHVLSSNAELSYKWIVTIDLMLLLIEFHSNCSFSRVLFFSLKGCTFLVIFGLPGYKHEKDCAHALICSHKMKSILDKLAGVRYVAEEFFNQTFQINILVIIHLLIY